MDEALIPDAKEILEKTSLECKKISLNFNRLSAFPSFKRPRVIALVLNQSKEMSELYEIIQERFEGLGIVKDTRDFLPHITIGRVKSGFKMNNELDQINNLSFAIDEIALIKSELTEKGSIYSNLGVYKLT